MNYFIKIISTVFFIVLLSMGNIPHLQTDSMDNEDVSVIDQIDKAKIYIKLLWETPPSFGTPEAVIYDQKRNVLYVSNYNSRGGFTSRGDRSPDEYISRVSLEGKIVQLKWIDGLISPTGMDIYHDKLFVVERGSLVEIDIETAQIVNRTPITGSLFPNDIVFDSNGIGYISDNSQKAKVTVYRFINGKIEPWIRSPQMYLVNGLCIDQGWLLGSEFNNGYLKRIRLSDGVVENVTAIDTTKPLFDGLCKIDENGYIASDWQGQVYLLNKPNRTTKILDLSQISPVSGSRINSADIEYIPQKKLIIIPTFLDNRIIAYELLD